MVNSSHLFSCLHSQFQGFLQILNLFHNVYDYYIVCRAFPFNLVYYFGFRYISTRVVPAKMSFSSTIIALIIFCRLSLLFLWWTFLCILILIPGVVVLELPEVPKLVDRVGPLKFGKEHFILNGGKYNWFWGKSRVFFDLTNRTLSLLQLHLQGQEYPRDLLYHPPAGTFIYPDHLLQHPDHPLLHLQNSQILLCEVSIISDCYLKYNHY